MPPRKVTNEQAREHERRAWELRTRGWSQTRIGAELSLDQSTISKALQRVSARVLAELRPQVEAMKAEQTAQLEHLLDEAVQAWERSRRPKVTTADGDDVKTVTLETAGEPRFLAEARALLTSIRDLWGLDAPAKQEVTGKDGGPIEHDHDHRHTLDAADVAFARGLLGVAGGDVPPDDRPQPVDT